MLEFAAPVFLLLGVAGVHVGYFRLVRSVLTQQRVQIPAFPSPRLAAEPASVARAAPRSHLRRGEPREFQPCRRARAMRIGDAVFRQPLICGRGLTITGEALFFEPVKVVGDLIITGRAVFERPVVVNGDARVLGDAVFHQGLLIKSELLILGHVIIGSQDQRSWLVARQARVRGGLWLNGELETTHQAASIKGVA
jgi:hypothetical protein